jgi:hypothetical protein
VGQYGRYGIKTEINFVNFEVTKADTFVTADKSSFGAFIPVVLPTGDRKRARSVACAVGRAYIRGRLQNGASGVKWSRCSELFLTHLKFK